MVLWAKLDVHCAGQGAGRCRRRRMGGNLGTIEDSFAPKTLKLTFGIAAFEPVETFVHAGL